jgi:hypothetical protein
VGVDINRAQDEAFILGDDTRKIVHDTDIVISDHSEGDAILRSPFPTPPGLHHPIAIATAQLRGVRAVLTMDLDTTVDRDESEDGVTIDGLAATGQLIVEALQVAVDD